MHTASKTASESRIGGGGRGQGLLKGDGEPNPLIWMIKDGIFARKRSEEGSIEHSGGCGVQRWKDVLRLEERGTDEGEGREGV